METTEFRVDSCVLVVATYAQRFVLHFGKELPIEREFSNFVDCYTVAVKKDFSNYVPSGFENSFRSDHARFVAKMLQNISNINIAQRTLREMQNLTR